MLCTARRDSGHFTVRGRARQWHRHLHVAQITTTSSYIRIPNVLNTERLNSTAATRYSRIARVRPSIDQHASAAVSSLRRHVILSSRNGIAICSRRTQHFGTLTVVTRFSTHTASYAISKPSNLTSRSSVSSRLTPVKTSTLPAYNPVLAKTRVTGPGTSVSAGLLKARQDDVPRRQAEEEAKRKAKAEVLASERWRREALERQKIQREGQKREALEQERERVKAQERAARARAEARARALIAAEKAAQARAVTRDLNHRHAIADAERLSVQWCDMDDNQKQHEIRTLKFPSIVMQVLHERAFTIRQEAFKIYGEQVKQRQEAEREALQKRRREAEERRSEAEEAKEFASPDELSLHHLNARLRLKQNFNSDDRVAKVQSFAHYGSFREVFDEHNTKAVSTTGSLLELERSLESIAKSATSGRSKYQEMNKGASGSEAKDCTPTSKERASSHDLARLVTLQLSRLRADKVVSNFVIELTTHRLRAFSRFRRFEYDDPLGVPEFVLGQIHQDEYDDASRAYMAAHRNVEADPLAIPGDVLTQGLSDEARKFLSTFPHYRLTQDTRASAVVFREQAPRTSGTVEDNIALNKLSDAAERLRISRANRRLKHRCSLMHLELLRCRRLLKDGSHTQQQLFYLTEVIGNSISFLWGDLNMHVFSGNITKSAISNAQSITDTLRSQVAMASHSKLFPAMQDTMTRLLSTLKRLDMLVTTPGRMSHRVLPVRRMCIQLWKNFRIDFLSYRKDVLLFLNRPENTMASVEEKAKITSHIQYYIAQLERRLVDAAQVGAGHIVRRISVDRQLERNIAPTRSSKAHVEDQTSSAAVVARKSASGREPALQRRRRDNLKQPGSLSTYVRSSTRAKSKFTAWWRKPRKGIPYIESRGWHDEPTPSSDTALGSSPHTKSSQKRRSRSSMTRPPRKETMSTQLVTYTPFSGTTLDSSHTFRPTPSLRAALQPISHHSARTADYDEQAEYHSDSALNNYFPQVPAFTMSDTIVQEIQQSSPDGTVCWQYDLFRGPDGKQPILHYCTSKVHVENVTQLFLNERILGFDLEWAPNATKHAPLKDNVSLIQLASEERIALFQIALHSGNDIDSLMAPTLKHILESPDIVKAGVAVKADCTRLEKWLGVTARGTFELSHLYKLVKFGNDAPALVNKLPVGLAAQVMDLFGMPLSKGEVRQSAWNQYLSSRQCKYAATDAYAGYQLFCELERRRLALRPTPPRPAFAELRLPIALAKGIVVNKRADTGIEPGDFQEIRNSTRKHTEEAKEPAVSDASSVDVPPSTSGTEDDCPKSSLIGNLFTRLLPRFPHLLTSAREVTGPDTHDRLLGRNEEQVTPSTPGHAFESAEPSNNRVFTALEKATEIWMANRVSNIATDHGSRARGPQLRAYHLWHAHGMSIEEIAELRPPAIKPATVAMYIAETVRLEREPYDKDRLKHVLNTIPFSQRWRYQSLERKLS